MYKILLPVLLVAQAIAHPTSEGHSTAQIIRSRQSGHGDSHGAKEGGGHDMGSTGGMGGMGGMGGLGGGVIDSLSNSAITYPALQFVVPMLPKMALYKKEQFQATSKRANAKKYKLWYGPLDLDSKEEKKKNPNKHIIGMDPQGTTFMNRADSFPGDITILSAKVSLVFEDGKTADAKNGIYNHHVVFTDTDKRPIALLACPGQKAKPALPVSVTVGTGEENTSFQYAPESGEIDGGYYVGKRDTLLLAAELVNYSSEKKRVYALIDIDYVPGKGKSDISSETVQVGMCGGAIGIRPPPGQKKFSMASKAMTVQYDGYIFGIRGHLHDGGVSVPVQINNKTVCESKANYKTGGDSATSLTSMSICDQVIPVKKGDQMTFTAGYDLELHPARQHAGGGEAEEMGTILFNFAASDTSAKSSSGDGLWNTLTSMLGFGGKQ